MRCGCRDCRRERASRRPARATACPLHSVPRAESGRGATPPAGGRAPGAAARPTPGDVGRTATPFSSSTLWIPVSPRRCASVCASRMAWSRISEEGSGTALATSSTARSSSRPVGSPAAARTILPPGGSGVSRETRATASAALFTHAACTSRESRYTGFAWTASRACRSGASVQPFASQPCPTTQPCEGAPAATAATASALVRAPASRTRRRARAHMAKWVWPSTKPGVMSVSGQSKRGRCPGARRSISTALPTP